MMKILQHAKNIFFAHLTKEIGILLIELQKIKVIVIIYSICLQVSLKNQVSIPVYTCTSGFLVLRINQSDATLLCGLTNKMQFYYMTYILNICVFMVPDRAFAWDGYCCVGWCHCFI